MLAGQERKAKPFIQFRFTGWKNRYRIAAPGLPYPKDWFAQSLQIAGSPLHAPLKWRSTRSSSRRGKHSCGCQILGAAFGDRMGQGHQGHNVPVIPRRSIRLPHVASRWQAPHLRHADGQGRRRAPPFGGRDGGRGAVLALALAGCFAAFSRFRRLLLRVSGPENSRRQPLKVFPCFWSFFVFCFLFHIAGLCQKKIGSSGASPNQ